MRALVLILFLTWRVHSQPLNFTGFEEGLKNINPFLGPLNRTALNIIFEEDSEQIGVQVQSHINLCTSCITSYLAVRAEFRSLKHDKILAIGNAANNSFRSFYEVEIENESKLNDKWNQYREDMKQFLPVTMDFMTTKINQLINSGPMTFEVVQFVNEAFFRITLRMLAEHGIFLHYFFTTVPNKNAFLKYLDERQAFSRSERDFPEDDAIILNQILCYEILHGKITTMDGNNLKLEKEITEELLNFTRFEEGLKDIDPVIGKLNRTALTIMFNDEADKIGTQTQKHIDLCTNCITRYLAVRAEFRSLGYDKILDIANAANYSIRRTYEIYDGDDDDEDKHMQDEWNRYHEELKQFLPVTMDFLTTKINELRTLNETEILVFFVENAFLRSVERILAQHGIFLGGRTETFSNKYAYLKHLDEYQIMARTDWKDLGEREAIVLNKQICYDILHSKITTMDGNILNMEKEITQEPLNFTRLFQGIENVDPDFGPVDRTALRTTINEKASEIGISPQEQLNVCADTVESYLKIRAELRNLSDVEILIVDKIVKESEKIMAPLERTFDDLLTINITSDVSEIVARMREEWKRELENLNRHLPITIGYAKTKMNELRILNASIDVVHLVQQITDRIIKRFLSERGVKISISGEIYGRESFQKWVEKEDAKNYNMLFFYEKEDRALTNNYLCYEVLNGRLKSSKKEYLNFEKRLIEEPINYSPLIDHFKSIHYTFNFLDSSFIEEDFINEASILGILNKDYLDICADCMTRYRIIIIEHRSISEMDKSEVKKILARAKPKLERLAQFLPVTIEFLMLKIEEMKKFGHSEKALAFVQNTILQIIKKNVVEENMKIMSDSSSVPFIILKRLIEIDESYRTLSNEDKLLVNRFFCYDFLKRNIIKGINKWT